MKMIKTTRHPSLWIVLLGLTLGSLGSALTANAQELFPSKPIRLVTLTHP